MSNAALATIGHNNPPTDEPTPFDLSVKEIENLLIEAKNWLDGEEVETQAQADAVSRLMDDLRQAKSQAEKRREEEYRPFNEGKAAVQEKYAPLIADTTKMKGKVLLAIESCKAALTPFLNKQEAEKRRIAEEARKEAEAKAAAAQEAFRQSQATDLAAREKAEALLADAKKAEAAASKAENDKAHAKGGRRAVGLRTTYEAEITDARAFAAHCWTAYRTELDACMQQIAQRHANRGGSPTPLPGVTFHAHKVAV